MKQSVCPKYKLEWNSTPLQEKENFFKDKHKTKTGVRTALNSLKASVHVLKNSKTDRQDTQSHVSNQGWGFKKEDNNQHDF